MVAIDAVGEGRPLALLHGVGASRAIWRHVTAPLAASGRRVLAPDLPGFGDSPPAGPGFALDPVAGVLADALAERTAEPFDLVGNSLGGAVAFALARARPELVARLVLVSPAGFSSHPAPLAAAVGQAGGSLTAVRRVVGTPFADSGLARRVMLWGAVAAPQRLPADDARMMLQASRGSTRIGAAIAAVLSADLGSELSRLETPLGLIWGERDRVVPISALASIRGVRPEAIVETLPGAAHVPQIERPAEFVAALLSVLERL